MASGSTGYSRQSEDEDQDYARQTAAETIASTAQRVKNEAVEIGQDAADKIDEKREPVASAFEAAATSLHVNADSLPGGEKVANLAHKTADRLQDTADYVRERDIRTMLGDVERFIKNHPAESLAVAAGIGFFLGRVFRRSGAD
jgi:ElaB/YqjD/DUF883 family membrane-anchored ribosome-binding protein